MVYNKPVQILINAPRLAKVFINLVVGYSPPRLPQLNCTLRLGCHLKVLVFFMLLLRHQVNYSLIFVVVDWLKKILCNKLVQILIDAPQLFHSINWDSILISKSWSPQYHFLAWLRLYAFEPIAYVFYNKDIIFHFGYHNVNW